MPQDDMMLRLFPESLRMRFREIAEEEEKLQEIRLRAQRPVMLYLAGEEWYLEKSGKRTGRRERAWTLSKEELQQILKHICRYSLYAYEEELSRGYLSTDGGIRVGITGEVIKRPDGTVKNVRCISSLNIRIAHEVKGAANALLPWLYENGRLQNLLLISPPGCGKTTLLRDIVRQISDGNDHACGMTVGLVDERSEIAACVQGIPGNDVGERTDVMDNCPKAEGMMMLLRSMSPAAVAVDELGGIADVHALEQVSKSGCAILATVHGASFSEVCEKPFFRPLLENRIFQRFLVLEKREGRFLAQQILNETGMALVEGVPC